MILEWIIIYPKNTMEDKVILERLNNLIDTNKKEHESILIQTTKTNGTVAKIQKWKYMITGGFVLSNIIIVPIVVALILKQLA